MNASELRKKFLDFFAERGHAVVPSSSLIPDDPSVLLTTAGMQQFKPYYTGEADPFKTIHPTLGTPLFSDQSKIGAVSIQKSFRTSDIDEVGDERHLTFFEMMGNFSFGGYFKEDAIRYAFDFLKEIDVEISYVTIFQGKDDIDVPKDEDSRRIWQSLGITDVREEGIEDVFWGPTGSSGPCGPTTEIYCKNGAGEDIEIWNIVFNEFFFPGSREELLMGASGKKLERLPTPATPGVDTGMGLERLTMVVQKKSTIFDTDLFKSVIEIIEEERTRRRERTFWGYREDPRPYRILADHLRAIAFLLADGVIPGNTERGYILRRLMRRTMIEYKIHEYYERVFEVVIDLYKDARPELVIHKDQIIREYRDEYEKFERNFRRGEAEIEKRYHKKGVTVGQTEISGKEVFYFQSTFGIPPEAFLDLISLYAPPIRIAEEWRQEFDDEFKRHQTISRAGSVAKFGGHGLYLKTGEVTIRDESEVEKVTRLHTATHLLHAGLRAVLGPEVRQDGSDITVERTRFDFRFPRKVAPEELKEVEQWVQEAIGRDLSVEWEEMPYAEAIKKGALGFFREKYPPRVKVYSVFDQKTGEVFSCELCGGPHVTHTAEIGAFAITKEESSSAGVRRIRAVVK